MSDVFEEALKRISFKMFFARKNHYHKNANLDLVINLNTIPIKIPTQLSELNRMILNFIQKNKQARLNRKMLKEKQIKL